MNEINIQEYEYYMKNRLHVVILGMGASCAAIPLGDKYGRKISASVVMGDENIQKFVHCLL